MRVVLFVVAMMVCGVAVIVELSVTGAVVEETRAELSGVGAPFWGVIVLVELRVTGSAVVFEMRVVFWGLVVIVELKTMGGVVM